MYLFNMGLISGVMLGLDIKFLDEDVPYAFSIVIDLLIIRFVFQKLYDVR